MAMTWHPCLSGTSIYWIPTETAGSRPLNAWAISLCVLSVTSCPRILRDFRATPNTSQPPAPLRNAHAVCIPSFNSPVVFFNSRCTFSSLAISLSSSSMFIVPLFLFHFFSKKDIILPYDKFLDVNLQQVGDFQYGGQVGVR